MEKIINKKCLVSMASQRGLVSDMAGEAAEAEGNRLRRVQELSMRTHTYVAV